VRRVWSACHQEVVVALLVFSLCCWNSRKDFQLINALHTLWNKCSKYGLWSSVFWRASWLGKNVNSGFWWPECGCCWRSDSDASSLLVFSLSSSCRDTVPPERNGKSLSLSLRLVHICCTILLGYWGETGVASEDRRVLFAVLPT